MSLFKRSTKKEHQVILLQMKQKVLLNQKCSQILVVMALLNQMIWNMHMVELNQSTNHQ